MAVPAFRTSPSRKRKRRSHQHLKRIEYVLDPLTGTPKLPHRASPESGYVRPGLQIKPKKKSE